MTQDKQYNGWTNYETWCVNLWLTNDQTIYLELSNNAKSFLDLDFPESALAEHIKKHVELNNPLANNASMYTDLLNSALDSVNYREIAKHFIQQAREGLEEA